MLRLAQASERCRFCSAGFRGAAPLVCRRSILAEVLAGNGAVTAGSAKGPEGSSGCCEPQKALPVGSSTPSPRGGETGAARWTHSVSAVPISGTATCLGQR